MQAVERRVQEILAAASRVELARRPLRLFWRPEPEVEKMGYFASPIDLPQDVLLVTDKDAPADLALFTHHGLDVAPAIWAWRQNHPGSLVLLWAWDNHLGQMHNLASALAADIVFPSHAYVSQYLSTPMAFLGPHLPACSAQWQGSWEDAGTRSDKLMAHYVDYPWAGRAALLKELAEQMPVADVLRMAPEDKRAYFSKSAAERLREWLRFKVSLVLPVDRDLSTRFFDALYAGQVPLVAGEVADLDAVMPPDRREELGAVHVPDMSLEAVRSGFAKALALFEAQGSEGIYRRHLYAMNNHMLRQRIEAALACVRDLAEGWLKPRFVVAPGASGLRVAGS